MLSKKKLKDLYKLLDELYYQEQKKSGMVSLIPAVYAKCENKFVCFTNHKDDSEALEKIVRQWGIYHAEGVEMVLTPKTQG